MDQKKKMDTADYFMCLSELEIRQHVIEMVLLSGDQKQEFYIQKHILKTGKVVNNSRPLNC